MENLDEKNLISGIVDAEDMPGDGATVPAVMSAKTEAVLDTQAEPGREELNENESLVERVLQRTLDRLADTLADAEERGFKRALEMARQNPAEFGITDSVPNFLADIRRDVWEN